MANEHTTMEKNMIIKLHLPDDQLQELIEICGNADLSVARLFEYFINDLTSSNPRQSQALTDWLCRRTGSAPDSEEEDEKLVNFSDKQVEIMNLLDLIMDS